MATRARIPNRTSPVNQLTAAALPLSPARVSPLGDQYNQTVDWLINGEDGGADRLAFHYFKTIPELHYLVSLVGSAMSQVRLKVVEFDNASVDDPIEVGPRHPARQLLADFGGGTQGQANIMQKLGIHLTVTGDSVLIGPGPTGAEQPYPYGDWDVYSAQEVSSRSGKIYLRQPNWKEEPIPDDEFAVRIWKEAPYSKWHSDSPVKSAFTVLREIELLDSHVYATAISRLKGAGILLVPDELTLPGDELEIDGEDSDPFIRVLIEIMSAAIKNKDSAAALAPIVIRGPGEYLKEMRLIDFTTQFDQHISDLRNDALRRLALGMDAPPEVLLGGASSAGWSMWQVSESQLRLHIKPLAHLIARSLTVGWLKPALSQIPLPDATKGNLSNIGLWPDFSHLTIRPDVGQDVRALYDSFEVGGDTYRHVLGLGEDEKPTPQELEYQVLISIIKQGHFQLMPWAIKSLKEHFDIPFNPVDELATTKGLQTGAVEADTTTPAAAAAVKQGQPPSAAEKAVDASAVATPGPGTPSNSTPTGTAPQIPGKRSVAKQTASEKAPPTSGTTSGNHPSSTKGPAGK